MGSKITDAGRALIAAKLAAVETMPLTVVKFGDRAFVAALDAAAVVDKGGGLVGLPATAHGFKAGMIVTVLGTANYDAVHTLDAGTTTDELVIAAAYTAENLAGTETATADPGTPPDPDPTATDLTDVVHTGTVTATGKINPDQVIYSAILDPTVGDFEIVQVGFYHDDGMGTLTLVLLSNLPIYHKRKIAAAQQGNFFGHSPIMSISLAATVAGVTVPAATWQFDFTQRFEKAEGEIRANALKLLGRFAALNAAGLVSAIAPVIEDDCEATTNWAASSGALALDATTKTEGANSLKLSGQAADADLTKTLPAVEDWSVYNGLLVDLLGDVATNIAFFIEDSLGNRDKWNLVNQTAWATHELDLLNPDVSGGADLTDVKKFGLEGLDTAVVYNLDNIRLAQLNDFSLAAGDVFLEGIPFAPAATSHAKHLSDWNADASAPPALAPPGAGTRTDGVYLDLWLDGDLNTIRVYAKLTVSDVAQNDYVDGASIQHRVEKIADILRTTSEQITSGMITDVRRVLPHTDLLGIVAKHVADEIAALVDSSPGALDTLNELAAALADDPNFATTITDALALKAPLASPALTGNPTAPTQATGENSTKLANTAFVKALIGIVNGIAGLDGAGDVPDAQIAAVIHGRDLVVDGGKLDGIESGAAAFPVGTVLPSARSSIPSGFLLCDGSAVSRTTYATLFAAIGTAHGNGNGSTTFHLPDYRGRFLRGKDGAVGRDPDAAGRTAMNSGGATGDNVGSVQLDALQQMTGVITNLWKVAGGDLGVFTAGTSGSANRPGTSSNGSKDVTFDASLVARTSTETRPLNAYLNLIIRY